MFPNARHHPNLYFTCHYMVIGTIMGYFGLILADFGSIIPHSGANNKQTETRQDQKP
jgi:hypothetical protein